MKFPLPIMKQYSATAFKLTQLHSNNKNGINIYKINYWPESIYCSYNMGWGGGGGDTKLTAPPQYRNAKHYA